MKELDDHTIVAQVGDDDVMYLSVSAFLIMYGIDRVDEEERLHANPLWAEAVRRGPEPEFDLGGNMLLPCELFYTFILTINENSIAEEAKRAAFCAWRRRACTDVWKALSGYQTTNPLNEDPIGMGAAFHGPDGSPFARFLH